MERLDRVVSKFLKETASKQEKVHIFFEDFLGDLAKLTHIVVRKLSADEKYIEKSLVLNTLTKSENYISDFNSYMQYHSEQWGDIVQEFKSPKTIAQDEDLKEEIKLFRTNLIAHLKIISEKVQGLIDQLEFLENRYDLSDEQIKKISGLKIKLRKMLTVKYEVFMEYLFLKGKLPQV